MKKETYKELVGKYENEKNCMERLKIKAKAILLDSFLNDDFEDRRFKYGNYEDKVVLYNEYLKDYLEMREKYPEDLEARMVIRHHMKLIKTGASQVEGYDENEFPKINKGQDIEDLKEKFHSTKDSIQRNKYKCLARNTKGYKAKDFPNLVNGNLNKRAKYDMFIKFYKEATSGKRRSNIKEKAKRLSAFFKEKDFVKRPTRVAAH